MRTDCDRNHSRDFSENRTGRRKYSELNRDSDSNIHYTKIFDVSCRFLSTALPLLKFRCLSDKSQGSKGNEPISESVNTFRNESLFLLLIFLLLSFSCSLF